jgi:hypothetical protein
MVSEGTGTPFKRAADGAISCHHRQAFQIERRRRGCRVRTKEANMLVVCKKKRVYRCDVPGKKNAGQEESALQSNVVRGLWECSKHGRLDLIDHQ